MAKGKAAKGELTFEQALSRLEAIVSALEAGEASLEEAIRRSVRIAKTYSPDERNRPVYDEAYQRYIRLYENLIPVFDLP